MSNGKLTDDSIVFIRWRQQHKNWRVTLLRRLLMILVIYFVNIAFYTASRVPVNWNGMQ